MKEDLFFRVHLQGNTICTQPGGQTLGHPWGEFSAKVCGSNQKDFRSVTLDESAGQTGVDLHIIFLEPLVINEINDVGAVGHVFHDVLQDIVTENQYGNLCLETLGKIPCFG